MGQVARGLLVRLGDLRGQRARRDPSRQPDPFRRGASDGRPNPAVSADRPGRSGQRCPRCKRDRDYRLRVDDLVAWESAHGRIPDGAIVLVRTGWGRFWPDKAHYLGSDKPGDTAHLHFPGISRGAAEWLARQRKVDGVGIDTASLDHGPSRDFIAHQVLNGAGIYGLENVANLGELPELGATLIALPMKIQGGSGAPTRVIAILPSHP